MFQEKIFTAKQEKFNLVFPFLFFPILIWEYFLSEPISNESKAISIFIAKTLFLNHVHVYFTFSLFFCLKLEPGHKLKTRLLSFMQ